MFDTLIESRRKTEKKKVFGVGLLSLSIHTVVIAAAVYATLSAGEANTEVKVDTTMVFLNAQQEQKPPEQQPIQLDVQLKGFQTVVAPTEIPTDIPPINLQERFDPKDYSGTGVEGGVGTGILPDQVFMEAVVEEKPELLSAPQPMYPELLRQAGIQGTVLVQVVIDTMGRAEPATLKIIKSPNPGFDQPTKTAVLRALFRPARVHGRAVRVLVQVPFNFTLRK